ncbi:unnamed protein product [Caenorhabditis auriculariae]|uniref:Uncharacterized protein n=1 Tax=Caenorhabditis auriculariae TaxID=2777116 RepID=A0A8S1HPM0_9PELO|nr:unnamed protein product [Caenorhabditis auriculariae]
MSDNSRAASPAKKDTVPGTYASAVGNDGTATLPSSRIGNVSDVHDYDRQFPALPTSDQRPRTATSRPCRGPMLRTTSPPLTWGTTGPRQGSLRRRQLNGASAALNVHPADLRPVGNSVVEPLETCQDRVVDSEQTGDQEGDGLAGTPADVFQGAGRPSHPSTITLGAEQISETLSSRGVDVRDPSASESLLNSSANLLSRAKPFSTRPRFATRFRHNSRSTSVPANNFRTPNVDLNATVRPIGSRNFFGNDSVLDVSVGGAKADSDGRPKSTQNGDALNSLFKSFAQEPSFHPSIPGQGKSAVPGARTAIVATKIDLHMVRQRKRRIQELEDLAIQTKRKNQEPAVAEKPSQVANGVGYTESSQVEVVPVSVSQSLDSVDLDVTQVNTSEEPSSPLRNENRGSAASPFTPSPDLITVVERVPRPTTGSAEISREAEDSFQNFTVGKEFVSRRSDHQGRDDFNISFSAVLAQDDISAETPLALTTGVAEDHTPVGTQKEMILDVNGNITRRSAHRDAVFADFLSTEPTDQSEVQEANELSAESASPSASNPPADYVQRQREFLLQNRYNITRGRGFGERLDNTTDDAEIDVRDQENHVSNSQKQD